MELNKELEELQSKVARKKKVTAMLEELNHQNDDLVKQEKVLLVQKEKEEKDVTIIEGGSLASFFYTLVGKKDEKIDKEQAEAYAATVKYDSVVNQLNGVIEEIAVLKKELESLYNCEDEYKELMEQKLEWIKQNNGENKEEIYKLEERMSFLKNQIKEITEARNAGENVLSRIESIEVELSSAEGWGTWDLMGGGFLTDMAKHSHLDDAQDMIQTLQTRLRKFHTELTDITIGAEIQVQIEGFLRFADYFFDGLFADWAVLDSIHSSQEEVANTRRKVEHIMTNLFIMQSTADEEWSESKLKMDSLIQGA